MIRALPMQVDLALRRGQPRTTVCGAHRAAPGSITRRSAGMGPFLVCSSTTTRAARVTAGFACRKFVCIGGSRSSEWRSTAASAAAAHATASTSKRRRAFSSVADNANNSTDNARAPAQPAVFNTVTGCLDSLPGPSEGPLKWYSCGPTVYDSAHLGHARTYVCLDIIRRILTDHFHFDVVYALGITDIDDKIIARGGARGLEGWEQIAGMARDFENEFMKDMDDLGVRRPDAVTRVTEHIPDIIAYIERILENGMAYEADGGIYFDVGRMRSGYGKLGIKDQDEGMEESELRGKRSNKDFALWKRAKPGEPWWDSPFGEGRPGWHIECSAMTHSLFGQHLDVHTGGIDLKFPHHTNEIAQCEAHACGTDLSAIRVDGIGNDKKPWVRHWLHTGHLHIEGLKMSKSLKNFVTVQAYLDGHEGGREAAAQDFRMFCLMHKYSSSVTFSEDRMEEARVLRGRLERFLALADTALETGQSQSTAQSHGRWGERERKLIEEISSCRRQVHIALGDDFDTPKAIRHLTALSTLVSTHLACDEMACLGPVRSAVKYTIDALSLLGVGNGASARATAGVSGARGEDESGSSGDLPHSREVIGAMVELRRAMRQAALQHRLEDAKKMKRELLELADATRDIALKKLGVHVDDGPKHTCTWMLLPPSSSSMSCPTPGEGGQGTTSTSDAVGGGKSKKD